MKEPKYKSFRFSLEELSNFICEFTEDGRLTERRDVLDWWRWFEKKCGVRKPHIRKFSMTAERTQTGCRIKVQPL
jgi:hypothetical protein